VLKVTGGIAKRQNFRKDVYRKVLGTLKFAATGKILDEQRGVQETRIKELTSYFADWILLG
jgi:hypothetical protein